MHLVDGAWKLVWKIHLDTADKMAVKDVLRTRSDPLTTLKLFRDVFV